MGFGSKTKLKGRNSEKRKEKSRDAARSRRSKETEIFLSLSREIPISFSLLSQMDKASVIRLAITHLKMRYFCEKVLERKKTVRTFPSVELENKLNKLYYKALNGFVMVLSNTGNVIYITESIMHHLGLPQVELLGQSVFDFVHPCDHTEMKDVCGINKPISTGSGTSSEMRTNGALFNKPFQSQVLSQADCKSRKNFFIRMKCVHSCKGRSVSSKTDAYRVVHCSGFLISGSDQQKVQPSLLPSNPPSPLDNVMTDVSFLVVECDTILQPSNHNIRLDNRSFVTHHTMDMKFIYCGEEIGSLLGYSPDQLLGMCLYEFHHALDNNVVICAYRTLFSKGQSATGLYRFLAKNGGYAWVETQASLVKNPQTNKPQTVICVNSVVSGILNDGEILAAVQQPQPPVNCKVSSIDTGYETALNLVQRKCTSHLKAEQIEKSSALSVTDYLVSSEASPISPDDHDLDLNDDDSIVDDGNLDVVEEIEIDEASLNGDRFDNGGVMFATEKILDYAKSLNMAKECGPSKENEANLYFDKSHFHRERDQNAKNDVAMASVSSSASLLKLLKEFDEDSDEMRAPFIPMDDLIFVTDISSSPLMSPIEVHDSSIEADHSPIFSVESCSSHTTSPSLESDLTAISGNLTGSSYVSSKLNLPPEEIFQDNQARPEPMTRSLDNFKEDLSKKCSPFQASFFQFDSHPSMLNEGNMGKHNQINRGLELKEEEEAASLSSSVLRNLLLKGEDTNYGYRLQDDHNFLLHEVPAEEDSPSKTSALYQLLCS